MSHSNDTFLFFSHGTRECYLDLINFFTSDFRSRRKKRHRGRIFNFQFLEIVTLVLNRFDWNFFHSTCQPKRYVFVYKDFFTTFDCLAVARKEKYFLHQVASIDLCCTGAPQTSTFDLWDQVFYSRFRNTRVNGPYPRLGGTIFFPGKKCDFTQNIY